MKDENITYTVKLPYRLWKVSGATEKTTHVFLSFETQEHN